MKPLLRLRRFRLERGLNPVPLDQQVSAYSTELPRPCLVYIRMVCPPVRGDTHIAHGVSPRTGGQTMVKQLLVRVTNLLHYHFHHHMLHCRIAVHIVIPHIPFHRVQGVASYSSDIWSEFHFHTSQNIAGKPSRSPIRRQLV